MRTSSKNFRHNLILLLAQLLFLTPLLPLTVSADVEESRTALNELKSQVRSYTLKNGLRVTLYKRGEAPVFAGAVVVRVGGVDETLGQTGISHMFEHMAFKGTKTLGTKDYAKESNLLQQLEVFETKRVRGETLSDLDLQKLKTVQEQLKELWIVGEFDQKYDQFGASGLNATTDKEFTKYFVEFPRAAFEFWCWIESERLLAPVMRQFYQERDVVMEERRMRYEDSPHGKLYEQLLGTSFTQHPYRNPVIGYPEDIQKLTASAADEFRRRFYVPNNIALGVVGDVDPDRDIEIIKKYFERLPTAPVVQHPQTVEPVQQGERKLTLESHVSPYLMISYHKPNYPHADDPALSLMLEMLAGSKISPLYTELVKKLRVAADVSSSEEPGIAYPNLMIFSLVPRAPHSTTKLLNEFDRVLKEFQSNGINQEALEIAKRGIARQYLGHLQSSLSLALDFASSELLFNNWSELIDWYEHAMSVKLEDVQRVAQVYLQPKSRVVATIQPTTK